MLIDEISTFFDFVIQNGRAFRILLGKSSSSSFYARLIDLLCSRYASADEVDDEPASHYMYLFIANGTVGMLREWVASGFPIDSRSIAEMMYLFSSRVSQSRSQAVSD